MPSKMQVWAPYFWTSPTDALFSRDLHRAQSHWRGEDRIWLLPSATTIHRWQTWKWGYPLSECQIPSEAFNLLLVVNLDEARRTYPLIDALGDCVPLGLYRKWLDVRPRLVPDKREVELEVPSISCGEVTYAIRNIGVELEQVARIHNFDPRTSSVKIHLPSFGKDGRPVVSCEDDPGVLLGRYDDGDVYLGDGKARENLEEPTPTIDCWIEWPPPFDVLFPTGSGIDLVYHQALMRRLLGEWQEGDRGQVARVAETWAARLANQATGTMNKAWFLPKLATSEQEALWALESFSGICAQSLRDLQDHAGFAALMSRSTSVLRTVGWLGYFWSEFLEDFSASALPAICVHCGRVMARIRANKRACGRDENLACFRSRHAQAERRSYVRDRKRRLATGVPKDR